MGNVQEYGKEAVKGWRQPRPPIRVGDGAGAPEKVPVTVTVTAEHFVENCIYESVRATLNLCWKADMSRATSNTSHGSNTRLGSSASDTRKSAAGRRVSHDTPPGSLPSDFAAEHPLTIGEVAQEYGITLRTLRFYEAKRLLSPHRHGATRLYRRSDRKRLNMILTARRLGFTLAEIKHLLKANGDALHLTREQCMKQIKLLEQQKRSIEMAITELREIHTSFYRRLLEEAGEPTH
jgi:DNA-binding transcriptional MerR regulator